MTQIAAFNPQQGPVGTEVTLTLAELQGADHQIAAWIGQTLITEVDPEGLPDSVRVTIPEGATTAAITLVIDQQDNAQTAAPFTVLGAANAPRITSVSPAAQVGGVIVVQGQQLNLVQRILLNQTLAPSVAHVSETMLRVTVPETVAPGQYWVYGQTAEFGRIRGPRQVNIAAAMAGVE